MLEGWSENGRYCIRLRDDEDGRGYVVTVLEYSGPGGPAGRSEWLLPSERVARQFGESARFSIIDVAEALVLPVAFPAPLYRRPPVMRWRDC